MYPESTGYMERFGCVLFDFNGSAATSASGGFSLNGGWASIEGADPFRIGSSNDLSPHTRWITNLPQDVFWKTGLVKQVKLKPSNYLRTDLKQIRQDIGLPMGDEYNHDVVKPLASICSKVIKIAIEHYGISGFAHKDLGQEIRNVLFESDVGISLPVNEALMRAYQDYVVCDRKENTTPRRTAFDVLSDTIKSANSKDLQYITLKRPRYAHAKAVLECSIPARGATWELLSGTELMGKNEEKIDFLTSLNKPLIAKVEIKDFIAPPNKNLVLSRFLNLGDTIGEHGVVRERNWVCLPELLVLRRFATLEISAALVADKYETVSDTVTLPYFGELSDFSYSLGLLSECVWAGLATRSINTDIRSKSLVSPRACWLKAADRFLSLTPAMLLESAGIKVVSYGYGSVTVAVNEVQIKELVGLAPHVGLSMPIGLINSHASLFGE